MNDAAGPWSRFGRGMLALLSISDGFFCFLKQKTHAGSSKSSLLLPPNKKKERKKKFKDGDHENEDVKPLWCHFLC